MKHKIDCATNSIGQIDEASEMGCTCEVERRSEYLFDKKIIKEFFDNYLLDVNYCNEMKRLLDTYPNNMSLIALILLRIRIDLLNHLGQLKAPEQKRRTSLR